MLNFKDLILNYLSSNPFIGDSHQESDANQVYCSLISLINSGNLGPENISILMKNLNEIIKSNMNMSNLIPLNQENAKYNDQQANLNRICNYYAYVL